MYLKPSLPHPFRTLVIISKLSTYFVKKIELYWQRLSWIFGCKNVTLPFKKKKKSSPTFSFQSSNAQKQSLWEPSLRHPWKIAQVRKFGRVPFQSSIVSLVVYYLGHDVYSEWSPIPRLIYPTPCFDQLRQGGKVFSTPHHHMPPLSEICHL